MSDPGGDDDLVLGDAADRCAARGAVGDGALPAALGRLLLGGDPSPDEARAVLAACEGSAAPPVLSDYEMLAEVGRGGMGVVWRARQRSLGRIVAVKVLHPGGAVLDSALQRFGREARALARLRHRHIVAIHEVGEAAGRVWFTMDLVEGESLEQRLREGRLAPAHAVRVMRQVASAVAYVHAHGLVHRDIKPANILLDAERDGDAVVTDFGLAMDTGGDDRFTRTGQVLGTPAYMSPEQTRGTAAEVGEATDVWAMGVVLSECLTGRRPFTGPSLVDVAHAVLHDEPAPMRSIDRRIPEELDSVVAKALAKRPGDRYVTAQAFLEDLERFASGVPVRAAPPSRLRRLARFVARHREACGAAVIAAAVAAAITAGLVLRSARPSESALLSLADEFSRAGQPGAAAMLYERVGTADERSGELAQKLADSHAAEVRRLREQARPADAVRVADAAIADGDRRHRCETWPGRAILSWERGLALAGAAPEDEVLRGLRAAVGALTHESWDRRTKWRTPGRPDDPDLDRMVRAAIALFDSPDSGQRVAGRLGVRALLGAPSLAFARSEDRVVSLLSGSADRVARVLAAAAWESSAEECASGSRNRRLVHTEARRDPSGMASALATAASDPAATDDVRRAAAHLLAEVADLPVGRNDNWWCEPRVLRRDAFSPADVVDAWHAIRGLSRQESLRVRVGLAVREAAAVAAAPWRGGAVTEATLPRAEFGDLSAWVFRHTGRSFGAPGPWAAPDAVAAWSAAFSAWMDGHRGDDPATWLLGVAGRSSRPGASDIPALVAQLRSEPDSAPAIHELLVLTVPADAPVPLVVGPPESFADAWAALGRAAPGGTVHLRTARAEFTAGRWRLVPDSERIDSLPPGGTVELTDTTGPFSPPGPWFGLHIPGFGVTSPPSAAESAEHRIRLVREDGGAESSLRVADDTVTTRSASHRGTTSHSGSRIPLGCVVVLDHAPGNRRSPDPFRRVATLALAEEGHDAAPGWTLDDWTARIAADLRQSAEDIDRAGGGASTRRNVRSLRWPDRAAASAHAASLFPVPSARASIARLRSGGDDARGLFRSLDASLERAAVLAGDASVFGARGSPANDERARPGGGVYGPPRGRARADDDEVRGPGHGLGPDERDEFHARVFLLATDPVVRALAEAQLRAPDGDAPDAVSPDGRGSVRGTTKHTLGYDAAADLADAFRAGTLPEPEWFADVAPPGVRDPAAYARSAFLTSVPHVILLLVAAGIATVLAARAAACRLAGDAGLATGAWLVAFGVLVDAVDIGFGGIDLLPGALGAAAAAAGAWALRRTVGGRASAFAGVTFGAAAAFGVLPLPSGFRGLAPWMMALGIAALPVVAHRVSRAPPRDRVSAAPPDGAESLRGRLSAGWDVVGSVAAVIAVAVAFGAMACLAPAEAVGLALIASGAGVLAARSVSRPSRRAMPWPFGLVWVLVVVVPFPVLVLAAACGAERKYVLPAGAAEPVVVAATTAVLWAVLRLALEAGRRSAIRGA